MRNHLYHLRCRISQEEPLALRVIPFLLERRTEKFILLRAYGMLLQQGEDLLAALIQAPVGDILVLVPQHHLEAGDVLVGEKVLLLFARNGHTARRNRDNFGTRTGNRGRSCRNRCNH